MRSSTTPASSNPAVRIPGGVELDGERIGPVEDYLDRGEALAAAGLA